MPFTISMEDHQGTYIGWQPTTPARGGRPDLKDFPSHSDAILSHLGSPHNPRPTPHTLPHLSIPVSESRNAPKVVQPATPDTPASSSPISGVIDLTQSIVTLNESPVTTGGFSDIYRGEWTRQSSGDDAQVGGAPKRETVIVRAFPFVYHTFNLYLNLLYQVAIKLLRILAVKDQDCIKARRVKL